MYRASATALALILAAPLAAQIKTPDRPVTDPKAVASPVNRQARAVPVEDIGTSRSLNGAAWSADGKQIFVATNLTGRTNIWRTDLIGTPEADPKVYDAVSPLTYIRAAKAPLLTIQGENDIRVPRGQAQEVNDILKAKGNVVETVFYPA